MISKSIIEKTKNCESCVTKPCQIGCPLNNDITGFIKCIKEERYKDAYEILSKTTVLPALCGRICPHMSQCQGSCVKGVSYEPVEIGKLEALIGDLALQYGWKIKTPTKLRKKVAVIGGGPAGLTCAAFLRRNGIGVTIYEKYDYLGGIMVHGIPEFRLPKSVIDRLTNKMYEMGIKIKPNTTIGANITVDDLFRDDFKAVFIGTGVWRPARLNIKGESLGHVHFAIEYLRNPSVYNLGKTVVVIGAGNVAMDVARTAFRNGAEHVYILCYKGEDTITAREHEVEYAKIDGAKFEFYKTAVEFVDEGVILADSEITVDENNRTVVRPIEGTEKLFACDSVIIAISQGPRAVIVNSTKGIDVTNKGLVETDEVGKTTRKGVFASGDVVTGAKTVVEAVRISKLVADAIDDYIQSENN